MQNRARVILPHMPDLEPFSAVPMQPAARELLVALAPVASRWGRWYVFGAQAVVQVLSLLEEALSQSDLVPAFEAATR